MADKKKRTPTLSLRSKRERTKKTFYFTVIDFLLEGKSLSDICSKLKISKQLLNYYIYPLKVYKVIFKIGYGVWGVNKENFKKFLEVKEVKKTYGNGSKRIRGHAFKFHFKIPLIKNWNNRLKFLENNNYQFIKIPQGQRIIITIGNLDYKVWLCNNSVIINFPKGKSYYCNDSKIAYLKAVYECKKVMIRIENLFSIDLRFNGKFKYRVLRHHYSHIENDLAKAYVNEGKILFIRDKQGILWGLIDNSYNLKELETVNKNTAIKDMDNVIQPYFNDIGENKIIDILNDRRDNPNLLLPSQVQSLLFGVVKSQDMITNNQKLFADNIQTHIGAIQELGKQTKKLVEEVSKIGIMLNNLKS